MGPTRSGGPPGLDPSGACPQNPKDGKLLGGSADYEHVVNERIRKLERRAYDAEKRLGLIGPDKHELAEQLTTVKEENTKLHTLIACISDLLAEHDTQES